MRGRKPQLTFSDQIKLRTIQAAYGQGSAEEEAFWLNIRKGRDALFERKRKWGKQTAEEKRKVAKECSKRYAERHKNDPKRKAWQKAYDQSPQRKLYHEQYRKENRDDINARHRARNATPEGKRKNSEYNAMWRKKNKEYDRKRKQEWWRRTHPNPKPIGRPKKEAA